MPRCTGLMWTTCTKGTKKLRIILSSACIPYKSYQKFVSEVTKKWWRIRNKVEKHCSRYYTTLWGDTGLVTLINDLFFFIIASKQWTPTNISDLSKSFQVGFESLETKQSLINYLFNYFWDNTIKYILFWKMRNIWKH